MRTSYESRETNASEGRKSGRRRWRRGERERSREARRRANARDEMLEYDFANDLATMETKETYVIGGI